MDGPEFRRWQPGDPVLRMCRVIVLSGAVDAAERATALGGRAHLEKPFHLDELLDLIAGLLPAPGKAELIRSFNSWSAAPCRISDGGTGTEPGGFC
jgi:DNA-binding response OmpR family regulator